MVRDGLTRRSLCASAGGLAFVAVPLAANASDAHAYGPHPRQRLKFFKARGSGPHPLVLMTGEGRLEAKALALNRRGISTAVVERRRGAYGFNAHTSDLVTALDWLLTRKDDLVLDGRLAFWAEGEAAAAALLIGRDRRYLQRIGMMPRDVSGMVLIAPQRVTDATFTVPQAYGLSDPPAVFRTDARKAADGAAFLSGLF